MNEVICSCSIQVYLLPVQKHSHHFSLDVEDEHSDLACSLFIFSLSHFYLLILLFCSLSYYYFAIHCDFGSHRQEFTQTHACKETWTKCGKKNNRHKAQTAYH